MTVITTSYRININSAHVFSYIFIAATDYENIFTMNISISMLPIYFDVIVWYTGNSLVQFIILCLILCNKSAGTLHHFHSQRCYYSSHDSDEY